MNKVYRVIFNHATQTWTAVSELAKGRTKTKSEKVATAAAAVSLVLASGGAYAATQILDGQLTRSTATDGGSIIINESISGGQNVIIGSRLVGNVSSSTVQSIVIGNDVSMTDGRGSIAIGGDDAHSARGLGTVGGQNFATVAAEAGGFDTNGYRKLSVSGAGAVGIGTFAVATGKGATALGLGSTASVEGATSVGTLAFSTGTGSSAFGLASRAEGSNTLALGAGARATQAGSIALGAGSVTTNGVAVTSSGQKYQIAGTTYDPITNTNYDVNNVVSVGNATVKRQIQNVAPGQITATSTDAINGSQLYAITAGVQQVINNHIQNINQNINNSGFNLQDNAGTKVAEVNKDDNLTFKNGNLTTSNVTANREVSFDVVTQNINVANGVPTEAGTVTGVATAKTVADAIKNSGFNLQANGQNGSLIKPGDTVSINSGDNTEVVKNGNTITVHANKAEVTATASDIKLDTKVTGRTTAYNISLADTVKQDIAKGVDAKTAVDKGFNVTSDSGVLLSRQLGDTVAITGGNGTGSFVATNVKTVNTATGVQVQFAENPEFKDITATSIKTGDNVLNGTGLTIGTASITNAGGINAGNKPITNVASGGNVGTNAANIDDVKRLAAAADTTASTSGTNGIEVAKTTANGKTTDYQVGLTKATQDEIAKGQTALTAINTGIYAFDGDDNTTTGDAPTGNISFVGGDNINTVAGLVSGKPAVTINLDPNIVVDNVTVGTVQISKDGGINAGDKTITGVANAVNANDAVNLSQLNATKVSVVGGANITSIDTKVTDNGTTYTINAKDTSASVSNAQGSPVTVTKGTEKDGVTDYVVDLTTEAKASLEKANTALQNVTGKDGITAEKQGDTVTVGLDDATKANLTKANTAVQTVTGSNGITATKTADGYDVSLNEATQANLTKANTAVQEIKTTVNGQAVKTLNQTNNTQNFVNGTNIVVSNDNGDIKISTNPDVVFENVTVGTVQISKDAGINAGNKTIQGVANGQNDNDAVNVSQLNEVKNALQAGTQNYFHTNTGNNIGGDPETNHGAVGQSAGATALNSLAAGINAKATAEGASAIGFDAQASGVNAVALGVNAQSSGLVAVAVGEASKATGEKSIAIGNAAHSSGKMSVALGDAAIADKQYAFAMGVQSRANADYSVAVGTNAEAKETALFGTAIGKSAIVTGSHSTAIGVDSQSVGSNSIALGRQANSTGVSTVALGHGAATTQNNAIAVGSSSAANGANSIAVGRNASTQQDNSIALGTNAKSQAVSAVAIGNAANVTGINAVGVGYNSSVKNLSGSAFGRDSSVSSDYGTALGANAVVGENLPSSVALGAHSEVRAGTPTTKAEVNGYTYTGFAGTNIAHNSGANSKVVSVGSVGSERQIQNVAAGQITATSTDAINGSQLFRVIERVESGQNFTGNEGDTTNLRFGETLNITGDATTQGTYSSANIKTVMTDNDAGGALKIQIAENPEFKDITATSIKTGDNVLNGTGLTIGAASITNADGINAGNKTIQGVANATKDDEAVNLAQLKAQSVTVKAGQNVNSVNEVKTDDGITYTIDAKDTTVSKGSDAVTVEKGTETNGVTDYKVDLSAESKASLAKADTAVQDVKGQGGITATKGADNVVTVDLDEATKANLSKADTAVQEIKTTVNGQAVKTLTKDDNTQNFVNGDNIEISNDGGSIKVSTAKEVTFDKVTVGTASIDKDAGINAGNKTIQGVADGTADKDAVNVSQLRDNVTTINNNIDAAKTELTNKGLDFTADSGNTVHRNLGQAVAITGGNGQGTFSASNVKTVTTANGVQVQFSENPNFTTVTTTGAITAGGMLNANGGLTVAGGQTVQMGNNRIQGVANAVESTDAVNLSQLNATKVSVVGGANITSIDTKVTDNGTTYTINAKDTSATVSSANEKALKVTKGTETNGITDFALELGDDTKASLQKADSAVQTIVNQVNGQTVKTLTKDANIQNFVNGDNIVISDDNGAIKVATASNVVFDNVTVGGAKISKDEGINAGNKTIQGVADATKDDEAVNLSQLNATKDAINTEIAKGLNFSADSGNAVNRKLGDTLAITGGNGQGDYSTTNVRTVTTADGVRIELADNPTFKNVKATDVSTATLSTTGDASIGGNANIAGNLATTGTATFGGKVTANGGMDLANNQINNVADGTADKDAVNVSQLRNNVTTLNNNIDAAKTELTAKGLDFSGNTGETHRDLGTKLAITGEATTQGNYSGANLKTVVTETGVALQFADNPVFKDITADSIKTGDNVLNSTGLTIGAASITNADGINAGNKTIQGVANATKDDEAVNLAQLKAQSVTVKAGQNVNSVNEVKTPDGITYTIDAKDTTVSKGSDAVTVEKGAETNGVTDYKVDLSAESKESLAKADSALQEIETQIDGVAVKTVKKDDNTANFITGDNIVLTAENGGIKVATAKEVTFDKVNSTVIEAVDARINNVQADDIVTLNLTSTHANINTLESHQIRAGDIKASTGTITDLTSNHITANGIDARSVDVISLTAKDTKTDTLATTGNAQIGGKLTVQNGIDATNNRIENVANATRNGDAVNLAQLKANTTTVVAGANITSVDKVADENGVTYTINAKDTSATVSNASSAVTVVANGTTNGVTDFAVDLSEETKESLKKANSGLQTIKTKVNGEDVKTLDQNDNVQEFVNGDNIEISNDNGKIKVATAKQVEFDKVTVGTASIDKDAGINAGNNRIQGVADGTADKDAVNVSQLRNNVTTLNNNIDAAKTELTAKGLDFSGNTGETHRDLGTKLAITGEATTQGNYSGANLKTVVTETGVALQFADNPVFKDITADSIKTGDNVLNSTGLTIGAASITNADGINAGNKTIQGVANATKDDEAVNLSQLNATKDAINTEIAKGLNFSADSGNTVNRKLGDTLAITGGNGQGDYSTTNVRTITTANGVEIQLADNPTFNNVKANDVQTATLTTTGDASIGGMLNANGGLTVANGQTVQMGNNRIQGVANAVESTDAVNLSQLNATKVSVVGGANITSIDTKVTDNGTTYTINAKDTSATVSSANEKALKVTKGTETNGITDFAIDLGEDTKASLAKADTAVQDVKGQGGITATKGADNVVTVDLDEATKANLTKADSAIQEIETQIDGKTVKTVKKGDNTANFITGDNIELTDENGAIKVATKKDVTFTNVNTDTLTATTGTIGTLTSTTINNAGAINTQTLATTGTATIGGMLNANGGLTVANGQTVNMGNNTISNVASGGDVGTNAANIDDVKRLAKSADTTASTSGTNGIEVLKVEQNGQVTDYQVGLTQATRDDIAKGVQASDDVANKGLTFTGDNGATTAKKLGDSLAITGDDNIQTTATDNGVAISLNRNLTADSLSIGNVVINNAGINAGNQVISNVANGVADTDAVNVAQLKANSVKVVAGANITSVESQVTADGTTYTINAKDTSASVSAASNALTVKAGEQNNGVIDYAIDLSDDIKASLNKANTGVQTVNGKDGITAEKQGDTVTVGLDDATKASLAKADTAVQVVNGKNGITATKTDNGYDVELDENTKDSLAKADTAVQNITTKVNGKEVKTLNQADNSQDFVDGDNITISNDNGAIKVATKQNVSFTDVKTGTLTTTGDTTVGGTLTANGGLTVAGGQTVNMGNNRIQGVANGVADSDAVNVAQLNNATKALNDNINTAINNTGWTVKANGDNGQKVANNGEVNFVQGDNIIIERSGTDITVKTTDNPNFKQVTAQSVQATTVNATTVNTDAVNAKSVQADTVKTTGDVTVGGTLTANGGLTVAAGQPINMGGNVVNGVAPAEISPSSTQAVNGAQIYELQQGINRANAQLNDRITGVEESAYGGTASAIATGLLPQAFNPGESLGGVAVGTYKGASAVAVGFSSISDNGKYIFRLAGGATSTGDYSGGAAIGVKFR